MQYGKVISPTEVGWVHDVIGCWSTTGRTWLLPDGTLYDFPPERPMVLVVGPRDLFEDAETTK